MPGSVSTRWVTLMADYWSHPCSPHPYASSQPRFMAVNAEDGVAELGEREGSLRWAEKGIQQIGPDWKRKIKEQLCTFVFHVGNHACHKSHTMLSCSLVHFLSYKKIKTCNFFSSFFDKTTWVIHSFYHPYMNFSKTNTVKPNSHLKLIFVWAQMEKPSLFFPRH